jgi:hypothetical protein
MGSALIQEFPTEILVKIFEELDVESAWVARGVCRYWNEVFGMVEYGSVNGPFNDLQIGVETICAIRGPKGEVLDRHILHGNLSLVPSRNNLGTQMAKWSSKKKCYEYWPGGKWRDYAVTDVLTDVRLRISGIPTRSEPLLFPLGTEIALSEAITRDGISELAFHQLGHGKFKDFVLNIDTLQEPSRCGQKMHQKHLIKGLHIPKWQMYGLLVQFIRKEKELTTRRRRHYSISHHHIHFPPPPVRKQARSQSIPGLPSCAGNTNQWAQLPPRLEMGWIEC